MNKVVLITGASRGIGKAMAETFAQNGYRVAINYNSSVEKAEKLALDLCKKGHKAIAVKADVRDYLQVEKMIEQVVQTFGHIDILINNAGITSYNILMDENPRSILDVINTNLVGTIFCSKCACVHMVKNGGGKIINMSSIWGVNGASGESVYSASKGGVTAFTKALAKELSYSNITVNAIAPGVVNTDMISHLSEQEKLILKDEIPFNRFATTDEISKLALYLASDDAGYITGQTIQIDGGFN